MNDPKDLIIIRCRMCNGEYFGNRNRITLHPGTEHKLPDELSIIVRKVPRCTGCKEQADRTRGGSKRKPRFER